MEQEFFFAPYLYMEASASIYSPTDRKVKEDRCWFFECLMSTCLSIFSTVLPNVLLTHAVISMFSDTAFLLVTVQLTLCVNDVLVLVFFLWPFQFLTYVCCYWCFGIFIDHVFSLFPWLILLDLKHIWFDQYCDVITAIYI